MLVQAAGLDAGYRLDRFERALPEGPGRRVLVVAGAGGLHGQVSMLRGSKPGSTESSFSRLRIRKPGAHQQHHREGHFAPDQDGAGQPLGTVAGVAPAGTRALKRSGRAVAKAGISPKSSR
jgi:hypothetical protein